MKKWFVLLVGLVSIGCTASEPPAKTDLFYSGHFFTVPQNAFVIASTGGDDNMLILRYGPDKGKKYLAFSDIRGDKSVDFGCDPSKFFGALFSNMSGIDCNQDQLSAFKKVFVNGHDVGSWSGDKLTVYFSVSNDQSFLFAFDSSGKSIKIDSDFLSKSELRNIVSSAL